MDLSWRPVALAVALASWGAEFVVVGSTATHLLGGARSPHDLDVVVSERAGLAAALADLGAHLPRGHGQPVRVDTSFGPLDVFVGPAPDAQHVRVGDVVLAVAAAA